MVPPDALSCVLTPVQIAAGGFTITVGNGFTVTVVELALLHPFTSVTVIE